VKEHGETASDGLEPKESYMLWWFSGASLAKLEALCRASNLWAQLGASVFPTVGRRPSESIVAQLILSLAQGPAGLAEAAMLAEDPLLLRVVGLACRT
jgi:hypothetical protein